MTGIDHRRRRLLAGLGGMTLAATTSSSGAVAVSTAGDAPTSLRHATGIVITYDPTYGFADRDQNWYGLRSIQGLLSKCSYAPPGQMTTAVPESGKGWIYDHSPAGIDAGGIKLGRRAEAQYHAHGSRICWINIEQWHSTNVPDPLDDGTSYDVAADGFHANTDYVTSRIGLRLEVGRFRLAILHRARDYLAERGLDFIEFADYNLPRKFNVGERALSSTDERVTFEPAHFGEYTDLLDAIGPQAQLLVREIDRVRIVDGVGPGLGQDECIEWFANGCRTRLEAFAAAGKPCRIMTCVWPIVFVPGGRTHSAMPPGMMTRLMDRLYDVGVRRFAVFQWHGIASVWQDERERERAHAAYEELAAWALAKGDQIQTIG